MKTLVAIVCTTILALSLAPMDSHGAAKDAPKKAKEKVSKASSDKGKMVGMEGLKKRLVEPREEVIEHLRNKANTSNEVNLVEPELPLKESMEKISSWTMAPGYGWSISLYIRFHADAEVPAYRDLYFEPIGGETIYRTIATRREASKEEVERAKRNHEQKFAHKGGCAGYLPNFAESLTGQVVLPFPKVDCDYFVYDRLEKPTIRAIASPSQSGFYYEVTGAEYAKASQEEIIVRDVKGKPIEGALVLNQQHLEAITDEDGKATITRSTRDADGHKHFPDQLYVRAGDYFPHSVKFNESPPSVTQVRGGKMPKRVAKPVKRARPKGTPFGECVLALKFMRAKFTLHKDIQDWHLGYRAPERVRGADWRRKAGLPVDDSKVNWPEWAPQAWTPVKTMGRYSLFFAASIETRKLAVPYPAATWREGAGWYGAGQLAMRYVVSEGKPKAFAEAAKRADSDVRYDFESVFHQGPDSDGMYRVRLPLVAGSFLIPANVSNGGKEKSPMHWDARYLRATLEQRHMRATNSVSDMIPEIELESVDIRKEYKIIKSSSTRDHGDGWMWYHHDVKPRWGGRAPGAPKKKPKATRWPE